MCDDPGKDSLEAKEQLSSSGQKSKKNLTSKVHITGKTFVFQVSITMYYILRCGFHLTT